MLWASGAGQSGSMGSFGMLRVCRKREPTKVNRFWVCLEGSLHRFPFGFSLKTLVPLRTNTHDRPSAEHVERVP